ncbi:MAG TPA: TauD/TfdA family dioxygenase [Candidatus Dormibacteraeota bacterium]|nr:TauD/TfdA family dioxygenase [Candidatus Dormibacteraeota bacterium]
MGKDITVTPLTSTIGARFDGLDLRDDVIGEDVVEQLRDALWKHNVVVLTGQHVGAEGQNRLMSFFGEVQPLPIFTFLGEKNAGLAIDPKGGGNVDKDGKTRHDVTFAPRRGTTAAKDPDVRMSEFQGWHTDSSFTPQLVQAASLRPEIIPPVGGDTTFASLCAAYDTLSPVFQQWLETLRCVHIVPPGYKESIQIWQYGDDAEERFDSEYPPREHPLVIEHPHSHRKALFCSPGYVLRIAGLSDKESIHTLRFLYNHIATSDHVYRHHWHPGDIVIWDELVCLHLAPQDYYPHERRLVRVTSGLATPASPSAARAAVPVG